MTHAVTCPGSRNAPLIYALAEIEGLEAVSVLDERAAGFLALGLAKASGRPVAVTCTSGTAAANLLPAVVEAHEARVPLIVLTADRPPELRDTGAGQAIDQLKLYGSAAKWFVEVGNHEPGRDAAVHHRALACRAWATAAGGRPGPVHLNFPLREPLAPVREELSEDDWAGRPDGKPWVDGLGAARVGGGRAWRPTSRIHSGVIVCGPGTDCRSRRAGHRPRRRDRVADPRRADIWPPVRRARPQPRDRALRRAAARRELGCGAISPGSPSASATRPRRSRCAPGSRAPNRSCWTRTPRGTSRRAWRSGSSPPTRPSPAPISRRRSRCPRSEVGSRRGARPTSSSPAALADAPDPLEPKVWAALATSLPEAATVWVSSSMPIRDVETFFPSVSNPIRFLANRGANGIDGVVSSAAGAALAAGGRGWLLTGELARAARHRRPARRFACRG